MKFLKINFALCLAGFCSISALASPSEGEEVIFNALKMPKVAITCDYDLHSKKGRERIVKELRGIGTSNRLLKKAVWCVPYFYEDNQLYEYDRLSSEAKVVVHEIKRTKDIINKKYHKVVLSMAQLEIDKYYKAFDVSAPTENAAEAYEYLRVNWATELDNIK